MMTKVGRPRVYPKRLNFTVRLTQEQKSRLQILAQASGMSSMNEWLTDKVDTEWEALVEKRRKS